jgi:nitrate/nitrite-specific signal transduction histidine kinase
LVNAFRHSGAKNIEVAVEYAYSQFRVVVRDNGRGIDPQMLVAGRDGHWGLPGMRERAERIGAKLHVWSSPAAGTEVEISVPGHIAFQSQPAHRVSTWLSRFYSRGSKSAPEASDVGEVTVNEREQ